MKAQGGPEGRALRQRELIVFPAWTTNNPYLNSLYLFTRARGWQIRETTRLEPFLELLAAADATSVVHIHWTAPIAQGADGEDEARARLAALETTLTQAKSRGAQLLWTIHNVLPHDCPFPDVEKNLLETLARLSDIIFVMNPATEEAMAPYAHLPREKVVFLPHPSYSGLYPDDVSQEGARARLGVPEGHRTALFFGQLRRYKGVDALLKAAAELPSSPPASLLMAGKTTADDLNWIEEHLPQNLNVIRDHRFVDDEEVQYWMRAADVIVLPFEKILNSGSIFLAATFGVPLIVPDDPLIRAQFGQPSWIRYVDEIRDPHKLASAIAAEFRRNPAEAAAARDEAMAFARSRPPLHLSLSFDEAISALR